MKTKTPLGVDLFYSGTWNAVPTETDVLSRDPVQISRGRSSETKRVRPTRVDATFGNVHRRYSPRHPASDLYGLIGRATPMRVHVTMFEDQFGRTVGSGWGTAPAAPADWGVDRVWEHEVTGGGSLADFAVAAGVGTMVVTGAAQVRASTLQSVDANRFRDAEIRFRVTTSDPDVSGAAATASAVLRRVDGSNYYQALLALNADQSMSLELRRVVAGVTTVLASSSVPGVFAGTVTVAFLAEGSVLSAKAWLAGEPYDFQVTAVDTTFSAAGLPGVRCSLDTGSTDAPMTFSFDDLQVRVPRAFVDIDAWPQRQSKDGRDRWVPIRANGIMQRLLVSGAGTDDRSALRRHNEILSPVAYWPMEEGSDATSFRSTVAGIQDLAFPPSDHLIPGRYAQVPGSLSIPSWESYRTDGGIPGHFVDGPASASLPAMSQGTIAVGLIFAGSTGKPAGTTLAEFALTGGGNYTVLRIGIYASTIDGVLSTQYGIEAVLIDNVTPATQTVGFDAPGTAGPQPFDGHPHAIFFTADQNGSNVDLRLLVDDQLYTATATSVTLGTPTSVDVGGVLTLISLGGGEDVGDGSDFALSVGHVAVWDSIPAADVHTAMNGHAGEQAHERIGRLASEEGIPIAIVATRGTELLGPQQPIPPLESMLESADADMGILMEPRGAPGLVYKSRRDLYNLPATAALSFAAGDEVTDPSEPSEDLDFVINDITVRRRDGGEATAVQESGPLNVNDPDVDPQGVGRRRPTPPELNVQADEQLPGQALWRRHVGTTDEPRYPSLALSPSMLRNAGKVGTMNAVTSVDIGDRVSLATSPSSGGDEEQHVQGTYDTLESHRWLVEATTTPYGPWDIGTYQATPIDSSTKRYDTLHSTLTSQVVSGTATSLSVTIAAGGALWTLNSASWTGLQVEAGGVIWDVTSITGSSSPQTINVTQATANGVSKTVPAGSQIRVAPQQQRAVYGL